MARFAPDFLAHEVDMSNIGQLAPTFGEKGTANVAGVSGGKTAEKTVAKNTGDALVKRADELGDHAAAATGGGLVDVAKAGFVIGALAAEKLAPDNWEHEAERQRAIDEASADGEITVDEARSLGLTPEQAAAATNAARSMVRGNGQLAIAEVIDMHREHVAERRAEDAAHYTLGERAVDRFLGVSPQDYAQHDFAKSQLDVPDARTPEEIAAARGDDFAHQHG